MSKDVFVLPEWKSALLENQKKTLAELKSFF